MPPRKVNASDHDLLIEINTRLELLHATVQESRSALSARIDRLAQEKAGYNDLDPLRKTIDNLQTGFTAKADNKDFDDLVEKVDATRRIVWIGIGILVAVQFLAPVVWAKLI